MAATPDLCYYCFDVLEAGLQAQPQQRQVAPPAPESIESTQEHYPLFVTWNTKRGGGKWGLRGCIGTFAEQPLKAGLARYAFISAFEDRRFNPITREELPALQCKVSLLVDFEEVADPLDWVVGKHGVSIRFKGPNGHSFSATFLPSVARDQGWDQKRTLSELLLKAGFRGKLTSELTKTMLVVRYQSSTVSVDYSDYLTWKRQAKAREDVARQEE